MLHIKLALLWSYVFEMPLCINCLKVHSCNVWSIKHCIFKTFSSHTLLAYWHNLVKALVTSRHTREYKWRKLSQEKRQQLFWWQTLSFWIEFNWILSSRIIEIWSIILICFLLHWYCSLNVHAMFYILSKL